MVHLALVVLVTGLWWAGQQKPTVVDIEVIEAPKEAPTMTLEKPVEKPQPKPEVKPAKQVFGISKSTITDDTATDAVDVKAGNTVAKAPDLEKSDDENSLPIPTDDYLVNEMPKALKEVRAPYPPEAKAKGITGSVVMDVLIDAVGKVRDVKLVKGLGYGLDEAALSAIRLFEFRPARVGEKAVAVRIRYKYNFVLEDR